jgi:uncharacterized protein
MKYLLLIAIALVLWWAWKKRSNQPKGNVPPTVKKAERIVECAHCGVLHPLSESLVDGADQYCCNAHRSAGKK